jgi:hypothetical protein
MRVRFRLWVSSFAIVVSDAAPSSVIEPLFGGSGHFWAYLSLVYPVNINRSARRRL